MWHHGHRSVQAPPGVWERVWNFPVISEWKRVADALPRAPPGGQAREAPRFLFREAL